uniref:Uncharacterized protein n=1 Tax=Oryza meridionalis TaxID=40149 RepID=A0A0E0D6L1_9ORYZ
MRWIFRLFDMSGNCAIQNPQGNFVEHNAGGHRIPPQEKQSIARENPTLWRWKLMSCTSNTTSLGNPVVQNLPPIPTKKTPKN